MVIEHAPPIQTRGTEQLQYVGDGLPPTSQEMTRDLATEIARLCLGVAVFAGLDGRAQLRNRALLAAGGMYLGKKLLWGG